MFADEDAEKQNQTGEAVRPTVVLTATDWHSGEPEAGENNVAQSKSNPPKNVDAETCAGKNSATNESASANAPEATSPNQQTGLAGMRVAKIVGAMVLLLALAAGFVMLHQRLSLESLFNEYCDKAQLIDMNNQAKAPHWFNRPAPALEPNPYWAKALDIASQLGENNRVLGDLNVKAAEAQPDDSPDRRKELEHAVRLYASIANAVSAETNAIESLVSTLAPALNDISGFRAGPDYKTLHKLDSAIAHHQVEEAINILKTYVDEAHDSTRIATRLKPIANQVSANKLLIEKAIPLFQDCVYYHSKNIYELKDERLGLDDLLKQGGYQTNSYGQLLTLADKATAEKNYRAASIYLHRCLGHHEDALLKEKLLKVKQSILESDNKMTVGEISQCITLLETLRALQIKAFGQTCNQVFETDKKICYLNSWLGNYSEAIRRLEPMTASPSWNGQQLIFDLAGMYSGKGECATAIKLLNDRLVIPDDKGERQGYDALVQESALLFQSDHYDEALKMMTFARNPTPHGECAIETVEVRSWH